MEERQWNKLISGSATCESGHFNFRIQALNHPQAAIYSFPYSFQLKLIINFREGKYFESPFNYSRLVL